MKWSSIVPLISIVTMTPLAFQSSSYSFVQSFSLLLSTPNSLVTSNIPHHRRRQIQTPTPFHQTSTSHISLFDTFTPEQQPPPPTTTTSETATPSPPPPPKKIKIHKTTTTPNDTRYSASDWLDNIRSIPRSSILRDIQSPVQTLTLWSTLVSFVHWMLIRNGKVEWARAMCITSQPHSFLVSSLGLLLVFRTNSAYQRFAEGRKIWERILSTSRNISRLSILYERELGPSRRRRVQRLLSAFPYLLRHHIQPKCKDPSVLDDNDDDDTNNNSDNYLTLKDDRRKQTATNTKKQEQRPTDDCIIDTRQLPWSLLPPQSVLRRNLIYSTNRPLWICNRLSREFYAIPLSSTQFTSRERQNFLDQIDRLSQCIGECERIHQTAVPLNYARHSLRSLTVWLVTLPFCLVKDLGMFTGLAMGVISWLLFGVYQIGYTIEDPFQGSLRLSALCDAIYQDVMFFYDDGMIHREDEEEEEDGDGEGVNGVNGYRREEWKSAFEITSEELKEWEDRPQTVKIADSAEEEDDPVYLE